MCIRIIDNGWIISEVILHKVDWICKFKIVVVIIIVMVIVIIKQIIKEFKRNSLQTLIWKSNRNWWKCSQILIWLGLLWWMIIHLKLMVKLF